MEGLPLSLPKGRTVPIKGDAVRTLRIERRWEVSELADRAKCSSKTIENVERGGKRVYAVTLAGIADALQVDLATLLTRPLVADAAPASTVQERRVSGVSVHFTFNFQNVDASDQLVALMERLAATIGAKAEIEVLSVKEGSVIVTLSMSEQDALNLLSAFGYMISEDGTGVLDPLAVSEIGFPSNPATINVMRAFDKLRTSDIRAVRYEDSHLHKMGLKRVWFLLKIAQYQEAKSPDYNDKIDGELNRADKRSLPVLRIIRSNRSRSREARVIAEAAYEQLRSDPDLESMTPDADEIFAARILLKYKEIASPLMSMEIDRSSGAVRIARQLPQKSQDGDAHTRVLPVSGQDPTDVI